MQLFDKVSIKDECTVEGFTCEITSPNSIEISSTEESQTMMFNFVLNVKNPHTTKKVNIYGSHGIQVYQFESFEGMLDQVASIDLILSQELEGSISIFEIEAS